MVQALIFDMDGTMIDSMPSHQRSWVEFTRRLGLEIDVADLMRRTTGRTGIECMRELFGDISHEQAQAHVDEKETVYRELFAPIFSEVAGFKAFLGLAQSRGLTVGVGTQATATTRLLPTSTWRWARPCPRWVATRACPASPSRPSSWKWRAASVWRPHTASCLKMPRWASKPRAAPACAPWASAAPTRRQALDGPHVLARVPDFHALITARFPGEP